MLSKKFKILVIDDHPFFLEGMKLVLESNEADHYCIETAQSTITAIEWLKHTRDCDLILCDLNMPEINGIEFIKKLFRQDLWIPIAIISASENPTDIINCLNVGAAGFINKALDKNELIKALSLIMSGTCYAPKSYSDLCRTSRSEKHFDELRLTSEAGSLGITPRQLEVLSFIAQGLSNKEISGEMGVSESTIKTHSRALFQILKVKNRTACSLAAAKLKLLPETHFVDGQLVYQVSNDAI